MAVDYSKTVVGQFTVGDGHVVNGSPYVWPPGVYPPGFTASICGVTLCGGNVALGTTGVQFGAPIAKYATQTRPVSGVASAQTFGTLKTALGRPVGGVSSAQQFGVPTVKATISRAVSGVASAQSFGTPTIKTVARPGVGSVPSAQAFGVPTVKTAVTRTVGGVGSAQSFGVLLIQTAGKTSVGSVPSAQAFGSPQAKPGLVTRTLAGIGSPQAFGALSFRLTRPTGGVPSAQAFGVPTVANVGIPSQTVPVQGVTPGAAVAPDERMLDNSGPWNPVNPGAYTVGARFTVVNAGQITHVRYWAPDATPYALSVWDTLSGAKLASVSDNPPAAGYREVALPTPLAVSAGTSYTASYAGSASANSGATPTSLSPNLTGLAGFYTGGFDVFPGVGAGVYHYHADVVYHASPVALPQFGTPTVKVTTARPAGGIGSAQAFGTPTFKQVFRQPVAGVGSAQAFGVPNVRTTLTRTVLGVSSAQQFGVPTTRFTRQAAGVPSAQAFGVPRTRVTFAVGSVPSAQAFGAVAATTKQRVAVQGVGSAQSFGVPWVGHLWLSPLDCIDSPDPAICAVLCGVTVCGGEPFDDPAFCLDSLFPPIVNEFLVGQRLVGGVPFESIADCLDSPIPAICDDVTLCGTVVCGGASFIEEEPCFVEPLPLIVNTFLCGQRLVGGFTYMLPTVTRTIDLQPVGCL